ncbi:unnamed protein product [Cunninghamella blakesleeana]
MDLLLNATLLYYNDTDRFYLLSGLLLTEPKCLPTRLTKTNNNIFKSFKNTFLKEIPDSETTTILIQSKKRRLSHHHPQLKKTKISHPIENRCPISQNHFKSSNKRNQDSIQSSSANSSKRQKQIKDSGKHAPLSINNNGVFGKYLLNHSQIFYARPIIDENTQQPSFIFNTMVLFGSNSIRNNDHRQEINHHLLQKMFPNEFKKKIYHLPKRMKKLEYIAEYLRMNHPISILTPLLNSICSRKATNFNTEDLSIPHGQVFLFIKALLKQILPSYLFGSTHNWKVFFKYVNKYIDLRRKETLKLYDVFWGLRINDCTWLVNLFSSNHMVPSELAKKNELLIQLLRWLFDFYIPKLLKTCFYITDHAQHRNRIFYYRHDTWLSLTSHYISKSLHEDYEKIKINSVNNQILGSATLRFIPKRNDLRIITNMKSAFKMKNFDIIGKKDAIQLNNNTLLRTIKSLLQYELDRQKNLTGSSVNSIQSAIEKIISYKRRLKLHEWSPNTRLYFSKVDIKNCFNNIDQNILVDLLKQIFMENQYIIQKYTTIQPGRNKLYRLAKTLAAIHDDTQSLSTISKNQNEFPRKSIVIDEMSHNISPTASILNQLIQHIKQNTILYNNEIYRQKIGISQGSCLSTILCNIYYGHVEKQELLFLHQDQNGLLLRYVDDFLYISTNRDFVERFDTTMSNGLPKYGCYINNKKKTNNLHEITSEFSWCGIRLSTENLDIFNDYSYYSHQGIKDSLTVETSDYKNAIISKSIRDINMEIQLLDVSTNTYNAMLRNIYEGCLLVGFKLSAYCLQLSYTLSEGINQELISNIVFYLIQHILSIIPNDPPKNKILWLILHAFYTSFKQHQQPFYAVIKCLQHCLNKYGPSKRLSKLIKKWPATFIFLK